MKLYNYMQYLGKRTFTELAHEFCQAQEEADSWEAVFDEAVKCERHDAVVAHAKMQDALLEANMVKVAVYFYFTDGKSVDDLLTTVDLQGSTWFTQHIEYLEGAMSRAEDEEIRSHLFYELDEAFVGYWIAHDLEKSLGLIA